MSGEAKWLGKEFVEKERELDRLFAGGSVNNENLAFTFEQIAYLQTKIRMVHLIAHLGREGVTIVTQTKISAKEERSGD